MRLDPFEAILAERIGLDARSIGRDEVARAVRQRVEQTGCRDAAEYLSRLLAPGTEWEDLAELVLVPETWFFREPTAFDLLASRAALHAASGSARRLSVLSLPCATGEEPYSAVMTLLEVGLPPGRFRVEAVDVSHRAVDAAREATYAARSVKRVAPARLARFFEEAGDRWRVRDEVRRLVRFSQGNLVDPLLLAEAAPFDIVFCRNVLIYLSDAARRQALATLSRLVRTEGLLLTGHAESLRLVEPAFVSARVPRTFAWVRTPPGAGGAVPPRQVAPSRARQARADAGADEPAGGRPALLDGRPARWSRAASGTRQDPPPLTMGPATLLAQATRLADAGQLQEARNLAARVVQTWPGEARGHYLAGVIASGLGDHEGAEAELRRAVYLDPEHEEALLHLAFLRARHGDATEARRLRHRATLARARGGGDGT